MDDKNKNNEVPWKTKITYTDTVIVEGATFASSKEEAKTKLEQAFDGAPNFEVLEVNEMSEEDMELLSMAMSYAEPEEEDNEVLH